MPGGCWATTYTAMGDTAAADAAYANHIKALDPRPAPARAGRGAVREPHCGRREPCCANT